MEVMHMFMFYNHPNVRSRMIEVWFAKGEKEFANLMNDMESSLGRGRYTLAIPRCTRVELYEKQGNDWAFVNAWSAPRDRQAAIEAYYDRQKDS